jgi:hypothetical protein
MVDSNLYAAPFARGLSGLAARMSQHPFWSGAGAQFWCVPWGVRFSAREFKLIAWVSVGSDYYLSTFGADTDDIVVGEFAGVSLCRPMNDDELRDIQIDYYCTSEADYTNWAE